MLFWFIYYNTRRHALFIFFWFLYFTIASRPIPVKALKQCYVTKRIKYERKKGQLCTWLEDSVWARDSPLGSAVSYQKHSAEDGNKWVHLSCMTRKGSCFAFIIIVQQCKVRHCEKRFPIGKGLSAMYAAGVGLVCCIRFQVLCIPADGGSKIPIHKCGEWWTNEKGTQQSFGIFLR